MTASVSDLRHVTSSIVSDVGRTVTLQATLHVTVLLFHGTRRVTHVFRPRRGVLVHVWRSNDVGTYGVVVVVRNGQLGGTFHCSGIERLPYVRMWVAVPEGERRILK